MVLLETKTQVDRKCLVLLLRLKSTLPKRALLSSVRFWWNVPFVALNS